MPKSSEYEKACLRLRELHLQYSKLNYEAFKQAGISIRASVLSKNLFKKHEETLQKWRDTFQNLKTYFPEEFDAADAYTRETEKYEIF